ncbi:MAG: DUF4430 domain-containing protein [Ruminococcus sp.]|nr:DUF4430 domain-containing protein [Ruminococcus sp.]
MKNKKAAFIAALLMMISCFAFPVEALGKDADTAAQLQGGICVYKAGGDIQGWINGELTQKAGSMSEWYIMALAQSGKYDFSAYEGALLGYLEKNKVASATSRQKYALALISIGSNDEYILKTLSDSVGGQGLMSLIFGLHIVNNGYTVSGITAKGIIADILALQKQDGGFAIIGDKGDPDCTAMTISALAPYYKSDSKVKNALGRATEFLSSIQQSSGAFKSFGQENCESTAQVMLALCSLGIDPEKDSRFIKNGNSLFDALKGFALDNGGFEHAKGEGVNESATMQALYTLVGYERLLEGKGPFFIFDNKSPETAKRPSEDKPAATQKVTVTKQSETAPKQTQSKATAKSTKSTAPQNGGTKAQTTQKSVTAAGEIITKSETAKAPTTSGKSTSGTADISTSASKAGSETKSEKQTDDTAAAITTTLQSEQGGESTQGAETIASSESVTALQTTLTEKKTEQSSEKRSIKLYIYIAVGAAALAGCAVLIVKGKRNIKSYIFVIAVAGALCAVTAFIDIETKEQHYSEDSSIAKSESAGKVTVSIDCLTILGESEDLPDDGYILAQTTADIAEGETAFDLLNRLAKQNGIILDIKGSDEMIYVAGISGIYEFDFGELSGWMYYVNGKAPSVNSSQYILKDGDKVEWRYTKEIGHDIE